MKSVNIQDIAREAGVGKATVSRVINGKGYVSRETAAKVKAVMERHHYQPSALARSLSKRESDAIGLIIPEANNPFFSGLLTGVSEVLDKCGYTLIIRTSGNDRERDYRALEAMRYQRVRGLIYVPACNYESEQDFEEMSSRLGDLGGPCVILDRPINKLDCDCVLSDNFSGAYAATEALIHAGHRAIGVIAGNTQLMIGRERLEGYRKAILQNGLTLHKPYQITGTFGQKEAYAQVLALLQKPDRPTAFFIANNHSEIGFLNAVRDLRLKIPADIAFVGFDELPGQLVFELPYSCLNREVVQLGAKAAQMLIRRFDEPARPAERLVVVPRLCLRGSEKRMPKR
ncbi:MAG: LacI family DNA-binding transcriptional regulator [Candidatus Limiplasma sp.]|nr:LacI family DNA-binding transcriptional regulator [Candidatus Limiplasma sp.]MEA5146277.1 LacI family DNA-binding transcriptional regulator [Candidatus Limiplasma sp.]